MDQPNPKRYTYADYLAWPEDGRWELIEGAPHAVDPVRRTAAVHTLKDGQYVTNVYGDAERAPVGVLPGCEIDLRGVLEGVSHEPG
jgi:hypothetical protein